MLHDRDFARTSNTLNTQEYNRFKDFLVASNTARVLDGEHFEYFPQYIRELVTKPHRELSSNNGKNDLVYGVMPCPAPQVFLGVSTCAQIMVSFHCFAGAYVDVKLVL